MRMMEHAAARAHAEVFSDYRPACTFVEVKRFIDPDLLVETEAARKRAHQRG